MHDSAGHRTGDRARAERSAPAATAATVAHAATPRNRRARWRARGRAAAPALLVFLAALAVYANTLANGFASDDQWIILDNASIRDLRNIPRIFSQDYWHGLWHSNLYRPVSIASFALTYAVAGLNPGAYHATNAILHGLCSVLVMLLARRLWPHGIAPVAAGSIFAVHPVHAEAVAAAFGRSEILVALAVLGALLLHAREYRWGRLPPWAVRAIAVAFFALAALSKESAYVLPALLLLYDAALGRAPARRLRDYAPYAAAAAALLLMRRAAIAGSVMPIAFADNPVIHAGFGERFLTAVAVLGRYVGLLLWPARLSVDYSFAETMPVKSPADVAFVAGLLGMAAFAGLGFALRSRALAFASLFFPVAIAPTSNVFFPIGTIMAERLLYLPSVSFALIAGAAAEALRRARFTGRIAVPALAVLVLGALSWRTIERNRDWRSNQTLFESAARACPNSFRVRSVLGEQADDRGDLKTAKAELSRAIAIWPKWSYTFWRLGFVLRKEGDIEGAQGYFRRAIEIDPQMKSAHFSLGETEQQLGRYEAAIRSYRTLEGLDRCFPGLHQNLGYALRSAGMTVEAEAAFRRGIECSPDSAGPYRGLAIVLEDRNDPAAAVLAYRQALERSPGDAVSANNLAWLLSEQQETPSDEALELAERALRLDPSATVYDTIAWIRFRRGDWKGARDAAVEAVRLDSASAEIRERWATIEAAWKAGNRQGGNP